MEIELESLMGLKGGVEETTREDGELIYGISEGDWRYKWGCLSRYMIELKMYAEGEGMLGYRGKEAHMRTAMELMWPYLVFTHWARMMLREWCYGKGKTKRTVTIVSCAGAGKSFFLAHLAVADFLARPRWQEKALDSEGKVILKHGKPVMLTKGTTCFLTAPTMDKVRRTWWSYITRAVEDIPLEWFKVTKYDSSQKCALVYDGSSDYAVIALGVGKTDDAVGKIKGTHSARMRILVDEGQQAPKAVYDVFANATKGDIDFKGFIAGNPDNKVSLFGWAATPKGGWETIDERNQEEWDGEFSDKVLHFNGEFSPSMTGEPSAPGMITKEDLERDRKKYGENSVQWYCEDLGMFPPDSALNRCVPLVAIRMGSLNEPLALDEASSLEVAGFDPAGEGGDRAMLVHGTLGKIVEFGSGERVVTKKWGLQLKHCVSVKVTPSELVPYAHLLAREVKRICSEEWGVSSEHFGFDTTGSGDIKASMQSEWAMDVHPVCFNGTASGIPLINGLADKPCDLYSNKCTELWFAMRVWLEQEALRGLNAEVFQELCEELNARTYYMNGTRSQVEEKTELKKRLGRSPDAADALAVLIDTVRYIVGSVGNTKLATNARAVHEKISKWVAPFENETWDGDAFEEQ